MAIRLLIVDDDPAFRRTATALLRLRGFEVVGEAGDGATAVAVLERLQADGVLLDVHLPDIDGFELARRLTARVLLTSSDAGAADQALAERCGAVGFVPKTDLAVTDLARYWRR
jgi:CheY-like chemotaxis protein